MWPIGVTTPSLKTTEIGDAWWSANPRELLVPSSSAQGLKADTTTTGFSLWVLNITLEPYAPKPSALPTELSSQVQKIILRTILLIYQGTAASLSRAGTGKIIWKSVFVERKLGKKMTACY